MITRNTGTKTGQDALTRFISNTEYEKEKTALIEEFRRDYPSAWTPTNGFNSTLFASYVTSDPAKGLAFAREIQSALQNDKSEPNSAAAKSAERSKTTWKTNTEYAQALVQARSLIAEKKGADALALLEKTKPLSLLEDSSQFELLKAEAADAGGDTAKAYEILAADLVKDINDDYRNAALKYGTKLGKNTRHVDEEIWTRRMQKAEVFKEFDLPRMGGKDTLKLSDLRGKVVMVDFWFPT
jgi:hypothetical protein